MPIMQTGHPDWIPTNSTPVTVQIAQDLNIGSGFTALGTIDVSSGGAYVLTVDATDGSHTVVTDIVVTHLNLSGNVVHIDFFGGVYTSYSLGFPQHFGAPTTVRGNIYGSTLQIGVFVAAAAWLNAVTGLTGLTASNLDLRVYTIPSSLSDPEPVMFNGNPLNAASNSVLPGNVLYSGVGLALAHGAETANIPMVPYAGPVVFNLFQTGVTTTPTNLRASMQSYSVAGGTSPVVSQQFATPAALVAMVEALNMPSLFNCIQIENFDAAQAATVYASVIASISG